MQKWNILIIECSDIVVKGICFFLQEINAIGQIKIEPNFKSALKLIDDNHYDLILLNLCIHNDAGFDFLERLLTHKPKSNILTFSDCCTFVYALRAIKIGAKGYFSTDIAGAEFVKAVELTAAGNKYMDVGLAQKIALQMINGENNPCTQLTTREFEVFRLQAKGLDSHQIAAQLCISYKTACNYVSKIREKLNVQDKVQLIDLAREYGLVSQNLRKEAEARFALPAEILDLYSNDELLHELHVQKSELEIQNEELRRTQYALEDALACYRDLYELAPVAYLTLTEQGLISNINLTGATLLGMERKSLLQRQFAGFIAPEYGDRWHLFCVQLLKKQNHRNTIDLPLIPTNKTLFYAHLDCLPILEDNHPALRVVVTEMSFAHRLSLDISASF